MRDEQIHDVVSRGVGNDHLEHADGGQDRVRHTAIHRCLWFAASTERFGEGHIMTPASSSASSSSCVFPVRTIVFTSFMADSSPRPSEWRTRPSRPDDGKAISIVPLDAPDRAPD